MNYPADQILRRTQTAYIWTRVLGTPFWWLMSMLSLILYKEMHISALQVAAMIALKPMSSILAPYWSQSIFERPHRVIANLSWSHILRYLPFLFIPLAGSSAWFMILAFGVYMMFCRGSIPAWIETCKRNLPKESQQRMVTYGTIIDYCGTALLAFILGPLLDRHPEAWKWLIPTTALLGLVSTAFLYRLPPITAEPSTQAELEKSLTQHLVNPWTKSRQLIRTHPDFARFLMGFMFGGAGLIVMQSTMPMFFVDTLNLSYTKMFLAIAACKGIGVALSTPYWSRLFQKITIHSFCALVALLAALFPFVLLSAQLHVFLVYVAFGLYGIMQGGSELSWHMSSLVFAKEKDSSAFSSTNVLMTGVRGCIAPFLGMLCYSFLGSSASMLLGSLFCLAGTAYLMRK